MSRFLTEKLKKLAPYVPGEQPKEREYIKLNTNESPFPPSETAIKTASEQAEKLYLYPDPDCKELTLLMAKEYGLGYENVIATNGSDEVLNFAFMAFCDENTPAIFPDITYGFYKVFADLNGVPSKEIPLKEDFSIDIEDYLGEQGTIFIANPNAPTGLYIPLESIERLLSSNPNRIVVVDEAYVDFGSESAVNLIDKYDNLLVTQTFSKSRSMAGARLGFGFANKEIINDLIRIKYSTNPYNVNRMTAGAGIGALKDKDYFLSNVQKIIKNREYVINELSDLGFICTDSKANFVFAKSELFKGDALYKALKEKGILIRHFDKERIKDYNRITIGDEKQMELFIQTIKEILQGEKI